MVIRAFLVSIALLYKTEFSHYVFLRLGCICRSFSWRSSQIPVN